MNHETRPRATDNADSRFLTRRDLQVLLLLAALFTVMLIGTWQRWAQPFIDHGREMNLPARVLAGEQLYVDVQFLYGPLAPHFNAFLYRVFGIHLATLQASGCVCAILIIVMIYWLARQLMDESEAALAAGLVLVLCALKATANYVSPYAYAALYGLVFALLTLAGSVRYLQNRRALWLLVAGAGAGLALASKLDLFLPAAASGAAAWLIASLTERKILWRAALLFAVPLALIGGGAYALVLARVPWRTLVEDNYALFYNFPPQLIFYNRNISGLAGWPRSLTNVFAATGAFMLICGLCALAGVMIAGRSRSVESYPRVWKVMAAGLGLWLVMVVLPGARGDASPLLAAPVLLSTVIVAGAVRWWRLREIDPDGASRLATLLVIAIFSLASIARVLLNVTTSGPYTPFFIPTLIIVSLYVLFRAAPAWLLPDQMIRAYARRAGLKLIALAVVATGAGTISRLRSRNTYRIATARGSFLTLPSIGGPMAEAIRYVQEHTAPNDVVLVLPEGTSINFLTGRRHPLREEIVLPGFLTGAKEADAIRRIESQKVSLILLTSIDSSEFRDRAFGVDYNQELMRWIRENYQLKANFGAAPGDAARPGDQEFSMLVYERR
ncbi:MAG TPA: glycosyltransferase family 39 protein [Blastocatellia bacterium]|nr:glycosyltransferase family 39 protein [Blastocatellia bacterium]